MNVHRKMRFAAHLLLLSLLAWGLFAATLVQAAGGDSQGAGAMMTQRPVAAAAVTTSPQAIKGGAKSSVKLPTQTQEDAKQFLATLAPGATYFTCPMHAEVVSDKATDRCPKCGMRLMEKTIPKPKEGAPAQGGEAPPTGGKGADAGQPRASGGAHEHGGGAPSCCAM